MAAEGCVDVVAVREKKGEVVSVRSNLVLMQCQAGVRNSCNPPPKSFFAGFNTKSIKENRLKKGTNGFAQNKIWEPV